MSNLGGTTKSAAEGGLAANDRAHLVTLAMHHALAIALIVTFCWYAIWIVFSLNLSGWMGLGIFPVALSIGYIVAQKLARRMTSKKFKDIAACHNRRNYRKQPESTQVKGK